jgi:hypothetical protein
MRPAKRGLVFLVVAAAIVIPGSSARAGHETVSEALLAQNVYLPYEPRVCPQLERALIKFTEQATEAGYPIYVAIIGSQADLGGAARYFGFPQEYAEFLGNEIGISSAQGPDLQSNRSLLTVMPDGFGFHSSGKAPEVSDVVDDLPAPKGGGPNDLARATIAALPKLARAARHPVPVPSIAGCSSGGGSSAIVFIAPVALLLLAAAIVGLVARQRASDEPAS